MLRVFKKLGQTLYSRLALSLFACFLCMAFLGAFLFLRGMQWYQREVVQTMHKDLASYVVDHYLFLESDQLNLAAAKKLFHDLMILGPNLEFYLLDPQGKILAYSTEPSKVTRTHVELNSVNQFINAQNTSNPILGQDPKSTERKKVFSAAPIVHDGEMLGYLYVILNSVAYENIADMVLSSKLIRWGVWIIALGFAFSLVATLWLTGIITLPVRKLTQQTQALSANGFNDGGFGDNGQDQTALADLNQHWQKDNANEIHILGRTFADLMQKLNNQHQKVVAMDHSRRELMAHVSHDLRTPLASLQGYLETWELNKDKLSAADTEHYVGVAKSNAQTLSKLVEQLFELAQLDGDATPMNIERLSMAELVQDVLQKFALQAKQRQITLKIEPKDSTFQVYGDIEKLDRVITNLVDNALRHTPDGGEIAVHLAHLNNTIAVKVSDTGVGIPSEDIAKVFEPHFKAGNTVRGNVAHGGLGLTITKRLLAMHNADISVSSGKGLGASFEFKLPMVLAEA